MLLSLVTVTCCLLLPQLLHVQCLYQNAVHSSGIGMSLSEPHPSVLYGWKRYVCRYVTVRSTGKFLLSLPATILHTLVCMLSHAWTVWLGVKMVLYANVSNFSCGVLQMIIILNKKRTAVQPCPPLTTTIVRLCAAVSGHTSKGLTEVQQ